MTSKTTFIILSIFLFPALLFAQYTSINFAANEVGQIISPQMSTRHMNQPSMLNGYAVLAGNAVHEIWDISNPYNPTFVSEMISNYSSGEAESHQVSYMKDNNGKVYFVVNSGRGIDIWDLTNVNNPIYTAALQLPGINYGDVSNGIWGVSCQGNYIYVGATNNGLYIVDATNKSNPVLVNTVPTSSLGGNFAGPLYAMGNLLVITTPKEHAGVTTLDISDSENPVLLDSWSSTTRSYIGGFYDKYIVLHSPIRILDVTTDPQNISLIHTQSNPGAEYLSFDNGHMFLGGLRGGTQGVYKYDMSNITNLNQVLRVEGRNNLWDDQFSVAVGNIIILADDENVNGHVGAVIAVHNANRDTQGPQVKHIIPENGAVNQKLSSKIAISFSDWIEPVSVNASSFIVRQANGTPVAGSWGITYTTVTFEPAADLLPNTIYEVVLPTNGIKDLVGNDLGQQIITTFSTGDNNVSTPVDPVLGPYGPVEVTTAATWSVTQPKSNEIYEWEAGDGGTETGASVSHLYNEPGRYPVKLNVYETTSSTGLYEAEDAILNGGVIVETAYTGYSGSGVADYPGAQGNQVYLEFTVNRNVASTETLYIGYSLSSGARPLNLTVNGGTPAQVNFNSTGAWSNYTELAVNNISLNSGANTIRLTANAGSQGPNIDYLRVNPQTVSVNYEAEQATLSGGAIIETNNPGYAGTGFVDYPGGQGSNVYIEWTLNRPSASTETLRIGYANGNAPARPLNLTVNNGSPIQIDFINSGGWTNYSEIAVNNVVLNSGTNTIRLTANAGSTGPNIDYLKINAGTGNNPLVKSISFIQIVYNPLTANPSISNTQIAVKDNDIWVTNSDANTITNIDRLALQKNNEVAVGENPVAITYVGTNEIWVLNKDTWNISILDATSKTVIGTMLLPYCSQPTSIISNHNGSKVYVVSEVLGEVYEISASGKTISNTINVGTDADGYTPQLGGITLDGNGQYLYISRFVTGERDAQVYKINASNFSLLSEINLSESTGTDGSLFARGIPNYLTDVAISPDGNQMWVASKKDNISRGIAKDGQPLQHDNSVRAIASIIDLATDTEELQNRLDIDNSDRCHAVTFSKYGDVAFVTMPGNKEVYVTDANNHIEIARLSTEEVPVYTYYDETYQRIYCLNFLGRSVTVYNVSDIINGGSAYTQIKSISTVANEPLAANILLGKQLFYDAVSLKLNEEGYMSCASCHLSGGHDGRNWDITNLGEGIRNTIDLRGKDGMGQGRLHWTGNFDEVHDFENQIRDLGSGTGLMNNSNFSATADPLGDPKAGLSTDLDALAAYVASLSEFPKSPYKNANGTLTSAAQNGLAIFNQLQCFNCHGGSEFTHSDLDYLYDVGTQKTNSGQRLNNTLLGFDVPTLKGLWYTAPYLHDGSAKTLQEVFTTQNPAGKHADVSNLSTGDLNDLVAFLKQIDDDTAPAATSTLNLEITFPLNGDQFEEGMDIPVSINYSLPGISSVQYYMNGSLVDTENTANFDGTWANSTPGVHEIEVKAFYGANATGIVAQCVQIEVLPSAACQPQFVYCDDGSGSTTLAQYDANCNCIGSCVAGTACNDNNPCTTSDVYDNNCNCSGTFADSDGDGVCNANDVCPGGDDNVDLNMDGTPDDCYVCPDAILNINNPNFVSSLEADLTITTNGKVISNANVKFHAGQKVELLNGFEVELGAEFDAYIAPCDE